MCRPYRVLASGLLPWLFYFPSNVRAPDRGISWTRVHSIHSFPGRSTPRRVSKIPFVMPIHMPHVKSHFHTYTHAHTHIYMTFGCLFYVFLGDETRAGGAQHSKAGNREATRRHGEQTGALVMTQPSQRMWGVPDAHNMSLFSASRSGDGGRW